MFVHTFPLVPAEGVLSERDDRDSQPHFIAAAAMKHSCADNCSDRRGPHIDSCWVNSQRFAARQTSRCQLSRGQLLQRHHGSDIFYLKG